MSDKISRGHVRYCTRYPNPYSTVVSLERNQTWKGTKVLKFLNSHYFRNNFKDCKLIAIFNT